MGMKMPGAVEGFFDKMGRFFQMVGRIFVWTPRPPYDVRELFRQMVKVGFNSIPVVFLTAMFTGMVMALQMFTVLRRINAESFVGSGVSLSMVRELAPVLTGLIVSGRAGSAMGAELGTMRVTEQIDALEVMATDPIHYLVVPRVWATTLPTKFSACTRWKPMKVCSASTMPVNIAVRKTTGMESKPTRTICLSHSRPSNGGRKVQAMVFQSMPNQSPVCSKSRMKARPTRSKREIIDRRAVLAR